MFFFFFFQAEDGIRDKLVTGVQTCALPIFTACAVAPDQTDLAAASVAPTTRAAASCMPSKTGSSSVPSPYQTAGTRARPTWRTTAMYWGSCTVSSSPSEAGEGETMLTV